MNVATWNAGVARATRLALWAEHLERRLPHVSRRSAALRGPVDGLLVDG